MPQSITNILIHVVFSTKNREPFLLPAPIRNETHRYLGGISKHLDAPVLAIGGVSDHIHLLAAFPRTLSPAEYVKELKRNSSTWLSLHKGIPGFAWQSGYGAFSVSESQKQAVIDYIRRQEEHHRVVSFQEEYRSFLKRNGVSVDEKYLWD